MLLIALCSVLCTTMAACDLTSLMGGGSSSSASSQALVSTTEEKESSSKSEEKTSDSDEAPADPDTPDPDTPDPDTPDPDTPDPDTPDPDTPDVPDSSEDPDDPITSVDPGPGTENPDVPDVPDVPDNPGDIPGEDEGDDIPAGKMLVTVYYYTMQHNDKPLTYSGLVDTNATLNDFFAEHMAGVQATFNEAHGYVEEDDYYYEESFFLEGFWQIGNRLQYGDSVLSDCLSANMKKFDMYFTPSGWGLNIGICVCEDPLNPDWMEACIPFPWGVCIEDFVNWAYDHGFFTMTYAQSLTEGYWVESGRTEKLDSSYLTGSSMLCFVYDSQGGEEVYPTEFTVYMPTVYEYYYSEMGAVSGMATKEGWRDGIAAPMTIREVYEHCYGYNPDYSFNYYMDGVQVSEDTILTKDSVVVCVDETKDVALPTFTVSVYIDGQTKISYQYSRPMAMRDAIEKYCAAKGLKMSDYTWTEQESVMASFDINAPWARDIEIYGYIYVEPEKPTSRKINVLKYDGEVESTASYEIGLDMNAGEFIRSYLISDFNEENVWENEYMFFYYGEYLNPIYGFDNFYGYEYDIFMIKSSVLSAGYNVDLDIMCRGHFASETYQRTYYMPMTLRQMIDDLGMGYYIDWMTYEITLDGVVLDPGDSEKIFNSYEFDPQYKDISVKIRPIYQMYIDVRAAGEEDKSKNLTFYGDVTLPIIVEALGLNYTYRDYAWKINESSEYYWEESGLFYEKLGQYEVTIVIEARKVYTSFNFVNKNGEEMMFGDGYLYDYIPTWDWSVNAKTAYETMIGVGDDIDSFEDFTWIAKGPNGEFEVTADTVLNYVIPEMYDHYDSASNFRTYYSLIGTRKTVTVSVYEQGNDGETEKGAKTYSSTVTLRTILAEYGYTDDTKYWIMVNPLDGGWSYNFPTEWNWDSLATWPIKITVYKY